ncbi:hypothetical protein D3C72_876910 [compost metagenome]
MKKVFLSVIALIGISVSSYADWFILGPTQVSYNAPNPNGVVTAKINCENRVYVCASSTGGSSQPTMGDKVTVYSYGDVVGYFVITDSDYNESDPPNTPVNLDVEVEGTSNGL